MLGRQAMATISNPTLFSKRFQLNPDVLRDAGLIDPFLDVDTHLFIDPILLDKSHNLVIRDDASLQFKKHFENYVRLVAISERSGDAAWKAASRLLDLDEPPQNGLGYGKSGTSGSSRPEKVRRAIMKTTKEIVTLGSKDPEMISLMGFFEENVGADTISDFTTRVIIQSLANITERFCLKNNISVYDNDVVERFKLPRFKDEKGNFKHIVLVPQDIVRDLPMASSWSELEEAINENANIKRRVNQLLAGIAQPTVAERKQAIRVAALSSANLFDSFLKSIKNHAESYDPNIDALGYYKFKAILGEDLTKFKSTAKYDFSKGPDEIARLVQDTISAFRHHVENGNLWEELWIGSRPKRERAAQLIYYAIADCFCRANDIDISPEANMGGGPVDFKFSKGFKSRVLVELKRSGGTVKHGYEKQLEIYKDASRTQHGIFVIMDYGDLRGKLKQIQKIRQIRLDAGKPASEIIVIDARRKKSASKR
jgi:hypothetical protein